MNSPKHFIFALVCALVSIGAINHASAQTSTDGLRNESEAGVVVTSGNAPTTSTSFKQVSAYGLDLNQYKFSGRYLLTKGRVAGNDAVTARNWALGLRYERALSDRFSLFLAQEVLGDVFAGLDQRWNTDIGSKFKILNSEAFVWSGELGYRLTNESRVFASARLPRFQRSHYARIYTEAVRNFSKTVSAQIWLEYLPNFTISSDWQLNSEISLSAALSDMFSVKTGYLLRFDNQLNPGATERTDTTLTMALVAKF